MVKSYYPFDSGAGANVQEAQWAEMAEWWLGSGVVEGELDDLEVFADASGMLVKVRAGKFWSKGHYFKSTAEESLVIGAADGANDRIDRVVVRVDWSGNTVDLAVLQGTPAGSPSAPALTQSATTWEISLAQVLVEAAVVTIAADKVTDERTYASATLATGGVATAKLAADSVDDTKAGNRVPQFYRRQGGSASNWGTMGTTDYTPTTVRIQAGSVITDGDGVVTVTFPVAFSDVPLIITTPVSFLAVLVVITAVSASQVSFATKLHEGSAQAAVVIHWQATGPE